MCSIIEYKEAQERAFDRGRQLERTTQDALDGAALRRLREALPGEKWPNDRILVAALPGDVIVTAGHISGTGATIAEAADKCREALK